MFTLTSGQIELFRQDGLLIVDDVLSDGDVDVLRTRYDRLFRGEFETGVRPDEVNWQDGASDPTLTRQICNGWKADRTVARVVCRAEYGRAIARCMDWPGARVMIDNVLWKPPGARSLGFHQDNAYLAWLRPAELCSLWMSMDDVMPETGAMELVRGSHRWHPGSPEGEFHGPEDYRRAMREAAQREGIEPDIVPVCVPRGGGSIHHGWTWHGSGPNTGTGPRRSLVLHAMSSEVEYAPENFSQGTGPIYARYRRLGDTALDENHFPVIWSRDGHRTAYLDAYCLADEPGHDRQGG